MFNASTLAFTRLGIVLQIVSNGVNWSTPAHHYAPVGVRHQGGGGQVAVVSHVFLKSLTLFVYSPCSFYGATVKFI